MRLPDDRGPLEHLYSLHIPNCDKHGRYNLKQVSVGQPGLGRPFLSPGALLCLVCCICLYSPWELRAELGCSGL